MNMRAKILATLSVMLGVGLPLAPSTAKADWDHHDWWWRHHHRHGTTVYVTPPSVVVGGGYYERRVYRDRSVEADVQAALRRRGYYRGPIDGDIGPGTRSAIRAYQYDHGLRPTGSINRALLDRLGL